MEAGTHTIADLRVFAFGRRCWASGCADGACALGLRKRRGFGSKYGRSGSVNGCIYASVSLHAAGLAVNVLGIDADMRIVRVFPSLYDIGEGKVLGRGPEMGVLDGPFDAWSKRKGEDDLLLLLSSVLPIIINLSEVPSVLLNILPVILLNIPSFALPLPVPIPKHGVRA